MGQSLTRRSLLRSSAALGGLVVISSCAPAAAPSPSASAAATAAAPSPSASAAAKALKASGAWVALTANQMIWPVAVDAGYFEKYGLTFDLEYIAKSTAGMAAMVSGHIDATSVAGSAVVGAQAGGEDVVMIMGWVNKTIFRIMSMPGITSLDQLKNKRVGVTGVGTADYFAWETIASKIGTTMSGFDFISAENPTGQVSFLAQRKVDAIAVSPPNDVLALNIGAHQVFDMASLNIPEQQVGIAVTKKWLTSDRDAATALVKGSIEAIHRWKTDAAFAKGVIAKYLKSKDQKFIDTGYSAYVDVFPQIPYPSQEGMQRVIDEVASKNAKAKKLKVADLVDMSIVKELDTSGFIKKVYGQ
ncbi:MAG: ABC transporter substrate-binding protein [Chloroflexi bacterium]|nr:ABC transporter substrate-binding protein [Chloroflexota bacterium]